MKLSGFVPLFLSILLLNIENATAQLETKTAILQRASLQKSVEEKAGFQKLLQVSKAKGWKMMLTGRYGSVATLVGIDPLGYPIYVTTTNNIRSAATIRTNQLWTGGSTGLNLNGSSANLKGKIGIWDGGKVRTTHVELVNRIVQKDNATAISDHSTHVAGTMVASGVNPLAKGMAWGVQQMVAYDYNNDQSEMLAEAPNLLLSNHSYSPIVGWYYNETEKRWEFYGKVGENEDYKFGHYSSEAQTWDSISYNAPNYLIVFVSGNNRNSNGPAVGEPYWRYDANGVMSNAGNRPAGISSNDAYDIIPSWATAKNILTVGAINPIPGGYTTPSDAVIAPFSSWGPTDDGRIKPDVVADGVNLLSSWGSSDNAYNIQSGTSMAAPSATGSLLLLQEYYSSLHSGAFMRAATLKGIVIHTADEAGTTGPDYQFGWGVINMEKAAAVITTNKTTQCIYENNLVNGGVYTLPVVASGKGPLTVTVSWTDPRGTVETTNLLNNTAKKLVNDLDIRVTRGTATYQPYVLSRAAPSSAATQGDNTLDNVEKIVIEDAVPGETYTIRVTHKGALQRGQQAYSLILSGIGGQAYCASAATNAGGSISSMTLGGFSVTNPAGCATYLNNTGLIAEIEASKAFPLSISLGSCNASSTGKIVKVFIDYNNNGNFTDAGETVAQSGVINGNGTFTGTVTTPAGLVPGTYTIMRVVVSETGTAGDVTSCGAYTRGQSEDFRVKIIAPSIDFAVTETISPEAASCPNGSMYVSVRLKNFGSVAQKGIPLTSVIKNGNTTVATLTAVYPDTIKVNAEGTYTFQTTFNAVAGTTYTITTSINLPSDQNSQNNQNVSTLVVNALSPQPTGLAEICGTNQVFLKTSATNENLPVWYSSPSATTPIAAGNSTSTNIVTPDKTYYLSLNDVSGKVGAANKMVYTSGGYSSYNGNYVTFTNKVPLTIESAKLYIGSPGRINFIVADIVSVNKVTGVFSYTALSSNTINVYATTPTPRAGDVNENNPADTGAVFYLNLPVPTAGNHAVIVQCLDGATIFRNSGITTSPYPFNANNIFSITGNSAANPSDTSDASYPQRFYYFFYNIGLRLAACSSPSRTPIVATTAPVPIITLAGNVLRSSVATGNQWYLNNNPIAGATSQTYTAVTPGIYKTVIVDSIGCSASSNEINSASTPVVDVNGTTIALIASPNPNKGQFYLQFEVKGKDDLLISLVNNLGQEVYTTKFPGFTGKFSQQINTGKVGAGMYFLKIQHNKKVFVKKLMIE